jgi:hypothetical protein
LYTRNPPFETIVSGQYALESIINRKFSTALIYRQDKYRDLSLMVKALKCINVFVDHLLELLGGSARTDGTASNGWFVVALRRSNVISVI